MILKCSKDATNKQIKFRKIWRILKIIFLLFLIKDQVRIAGIYFFLKRFPYR